MTKAQAYQRAQQLANRTGETYYVVYESGAYDVASEFDLDTYYAGNRDFYGVDPR